MFQKIAETAKAWVAALVSGAGSFVVQWLSAPETQAAINDAVSQGFDTFEAAVKSAILAAITWVVTYAKANAAPASKP